MIDFFSNMFGYVLNFIYDFVNNYGIAIILFSILIKIIMLPLSIKQQKTLKKNEKLQEQIKIIQIKHKGNQERINQEMIELYRKEKMNPFSGCFSIIIQMILLFAMFYLVRSPLTYMKKVDNQVIENQKNEMIQELGDNAVSETYPEMSIINYVKEKNMKDSELYINMDFLGLDLNKVPQENFNDVKVFIIPALYVISSFISIKISTSTGKKKNKFKELTDGKEKEKEEELDSLEMAQQMNKNMSWLMPILAVSVSLLAPLGLALYWLINNIMMIFERLILTPVYLSISGIGYSLLKGWLAPL